MAILLLSSTISWSVDKHLCMGRVMDVAFFHEAHGCGMDHGMGETMPEKSCCDDESFTITGQDVLNYSWDGFDFDAKVFLTTYAQPNLQFVKVASKRTVPEILYPPPLLVHDLNLLHDLFLI